MFGVLRRARDRLGRRGAILSCYGTVWALYGVGLLIAPQPDQRGLRAALAVAPLEVWAWAWMTAGLVAVVASWKPAGTDWLGFAALTIVVLPWITTYFLSWITGIFTRGWVAAVVWAIAGIAVATTAGWPEVPRRREGPG